ncbi:MAG: HAD-IC family P-type ATPase [Firmicutes bacterium]|nr:HAD-IC family P-type ATPase [Bacillota bacterium]
MAEATKKSQVNPKDKPEIQKGPKVVIKEDLIQMDRDPLTLDPNISADLDTFNAQNVVKSKDDLVVERYNPDIEIGLTNEDVESRIMAGLSNTLDTGSSKSVSSIVIANLVTFFNFLNFAIALWLLSIGAEFANFLFLGAVSANIAIGIIQEIRAKKMIDKLSLLSAPTANVVRDKADYEISVSNVVIDDILYLNSGKQIAADCVVREGILEVNESLLTGESDPILKRKGDTLYSGSYVVSGSCYAQVTAIGQDIYIQKLTSQAKVYQKPKSDLLASLKIIIRTVAAIIVPLAGLLFYTMTTNTDLAYEDIVKATTGAMIGIIPSGLFLLTSMALAVGVIRLAQNNTLVQELYCIEMLARVDMLCLDKTGTITDGTMSVHSTVELEPYDKLSVKNIVSAMINALNDTNLTSQALSDRFGTAKRIRHKNTIPFSSSRKFSAVEFERFGTFVLGAPEYVLKNHYPESIKVQVNQFAEEGFRVLCIARTDEVITDDFTFKSLIPVSLITIEDTVRPDAEETIRYFKENQVGVKVVSGDNPVTVSKIAQRVGIVDADKYISLEGLSDKDVVRAATRYTIFGRVSPGQKKLLIEALKNNGHTVAMTGDGVNDILALKEADTSIAMASGSEAARNVSHLVLLDSNFSSMPKVVSEGRRVINNVQKVAVLFLTKNIFTLLLIIIAIARRGVYPIQPSQLILIDYLVIGIPALILALEANNKRVEGNFLLNVIKKALPGALVVMINSLIVFGLATVLGMNQLQTSTIIVISATFTSLLVLLRLSLPFNRVRGTVFVLMIIAFVVSIIFLPSFFNYAPFFNQEYYPVDPLTIPQILLLLSISQAAFPMMYILSNMTRWIKEVVASMINKISELQ